MDGLSEEPGNRSDLEKERGLGFGTLHCVVMSDAFLKDTLACGLAAFRHWAWVLWYISNT